MWHLSSFLPSPSGERNAPAMVGVGGCLPPGRVCPGLFSAMPRQPVMLGTSSFQRAPPTLCQVGEFNFGLKCC